MLIKEILSTGALNNKGQRISECSKSMYWWTYWVHVARFWGEGRKG